MGFGNPPVPECILDFTTVVGLFPNHCVARFIELTGKMERLIDKFYFDTSSFGEPG